MIDRICHAVSSVATDGSSVTGNAPSEDTLNVPPRCSVAEAPTASQRSSPSAARDTAVPPTGTSSFSVFVSGSIDVIESSNSFATQIEPAASASELGPVTDRNRRLQATRGRIEARDGAVEVVGDPDRPARGQHRRRPVADALRERHAPAPRVDPRHTVGVERDPDAVRRERDPGRPSGERNRFSRRRTPGRAGRAPRRSCPRPTAPRPRTRSRSARCRRAASA